jgi:hypothetical protein
MKSMKKVIIYGFLIWLIPFGISIMIFPIHDSNRALFESIMPVAVTTVTVIFSILYFKIIDIEFLKEGIQLGIIWYIISLIIDLIMFMPESPMQMTFVDYMMDIGLTYVIIIVIPIGFGHFLESNKKVLTNTHNDQEEEPSVEKE